MGLDGSRYLHFIVAPPLAPTHSIRFELGPLRIPRSFSDSIKSVTCARVTSEKLLSFLFFKKTRMIFLIRAGTFFPGTDE